MDAELIVLASVAGTAVVQTVGTEAWAVLRSRVASLFRRQGPEEVSPETVLEWLDRTAAEVATAGPGEARQVRSRAALTWQTHFVELLEEGRGPGRYAVAAGLQEMVACARQTSGVVVPGPHIPAGIGVAPRNRGIAARSIDHLEIHQRHHSAQAPGWRPVRVGAVPPPASAFQPREGLQAELDRVRARRAVPTQVLSGGGGAGKSQLAAACARRARAEGVDVLVWADAADPSRIVAAYAQAAHRAGVPGADGRDAERDAGAFLDWLTVTDRTWLVVLDDLTDIEGAGPWWPRPSAGNGGEGRVLATTRRRDALVPGAGRAVVDVGTYTRAEALAYLRERLAAAGKAHLLDDRTEELIEALGRLPLALAHAAAHLIHEDTDSTGYLRLFTDRASRTDAPLPPGADTDDCGRPVTASLLLLLDAAQQREPAGLAVPAVRLAAHLDPAGHPQQLWATAAVTRYLDAHRAPQSAPVTADQALAAVRLLHRYGLLTSDGGEGGDAGDAGDGDCAVRLPALTARAVREAIPPADAPAVIRAAADALVEVWPEHQHAAPGLTAVLRANAATLCTHAGDVLWRPVGHLILHKAGTSLLDAGQFNAAAAHWSRQTADAERLLGEDHPQALAARAHLASYCREAGRTGEAIGLGERVVADRERLLGDDHPHTLAARHSLASSYWRAGRTGEAIELGERVLADRERLLGDDHPRTLSARSGLAAFYRQAGRIGEAIELSERALADHERLLGDDHLDTLDVRHNLASSYWQAGRTGKAIDLLERVLVDRERLLDDTHRHTLSARANLALAYRRTGRSGEAVELGERVLADCERLLGGDHPHTLAARASLASSCRQAGRIGEAIGLGERVLADHERLLGDEHPDTLTARASLAFFYRQAGRTGEAIELGERLLADRERLLGDDHPRTRETANALRIQRILRAAETERAQPGSGG